MIVPSCRGSRSRGGLSSGGGTSGRIAHEPDIGKSRAPRAAVTVKISSPSTHAIARACDERWPRTISVIAISTTDGGRA